MPQSWDSISTETWLEVFGRAHPILLHLPFGVLASLFLLELWCFVRRRPLESQLRSLLVGLAMISAVLAAGSGWFLGEQPDYGGETLEIHRKLGIGVAVASMFMAASAWRGMRQMYAVTLCLTFILLLIAGHYGGSMTHGEGFLLEPLHKAERKTEEVESAQGKSGADSAKSQSGPAVSETAQTASAAEGQAFSAPTLDGAAVTASADSDAASHVPDALPLLTQYCGKCHGEGRQKGGLALQSRAAILAGGSSGPAAVPGQPAASLIMERMRLPLEDDDHMPPSSKAQPTAAQVEAVGAWIAAGLPVAGGGGASADPDPAPQQDPVKSKDSSASRVVPESATRVAVGVLRSEQVHIEESEPDTGLLWIDFSARPQTNDDDISNLVASFQGSVETLSLAGTSVGDASGVSLGGLSALRDLDLSGTALTSNGVAGLQPCEQLAVLDVTGSQVDDSVVDVLVSMPSLQRVFVWGTNVTGAGVARLRSERPDLEVIDGEGLLVEALETEPEPVMRERPKQDLVMGRGPHTYQWVSDWLQLPEGRDELGNTHGEIVIDREGNIYFNTDTEQAVMAFDSDGRYLNSWGEEFASGLHGMQYVKEEDGEYLYFVHFGKHEFVKATLAGDIVWRMGFPEESGKYENETQFRPTSLAVAPDGSFFVADGYGMHWVHQYDADRKWVRSIGGHGSNPGQFNTPHGVWVDTRGEEPQLIVADRENHRLQQFDMDGQLLGIVEGMLRRPCKVQQQGEYLVIPDLAGRVTILDGSNSLVTHLGDNPDVSRRANNGVDRAEWVDGEFLAPHSALWDSSGNLYVMDWNRHGRISKLRRLE